MEDLSVASPATVSRCGMVYTDYSDLGWQPYVTSWIAKRQDKVTSCLDSSLETNLLKTFFFLILRTVIISKISLNTRLELARGIAPLLSRPLFTDLLFLQKNPQKSFCSRISFIRFLK